MERIALFGLGIGEAVTGFLTEPWLQLPREDLLASMSDIFTKVPHFSHFVMVWKRSTFRPLGPMPSFSAEASVVWQHLEVFLQDGIDPFLAKLEARTVLANHIVGVHPRPHYKNGSQGVSLLAHADSFVFRDGADTHTGHYKGLGHDGSLIVDIPGQGERRLYSAEILELKGYKGP